jgi:hypothetical protein
MLYVRTSLLLLLRNTVRGNRLFDSACVLPPFAVAERHHGAGRGRAACGQCGAAAPRRDASGAAGTPRSAFVAAQ